MSGSGGDDADDDGAPDSGPGRREVAYRLFAAEFDDADLSYSESDEERAPNYVVTPTGARLNRLFAVGVLTEVEPVNEGVVRGRVVDPTGAFVTYAGQYQPDALAFLERADPPQFVALTGKARTFQPDDSDRTFTSVRPESASEVDAATRDRWTVTAAEATLRRIRFASAALAAPERGEDLRVALLERGASESLAAGLPLALDHYGTTEGYLEALRRVAVDALEQVAGERDEVRPLDVAPGEATGATLGPLPEVTDAGPDTGAGTGAAAEDADTDATPGTTVDADADASAGGDADVDAAAGAAAGDGDDPTTGAGAAVEDGDDSALGSTTGGPASSTSDSDVASADADADASAGPGDGGGGGDADVGVSADAGPGEFDAGSNAGLDADAGAAAGSTGADGADADATTAGDVDADADADADVDVEGEMYEVDEAERERIESEYGTSFETGNEVGEPGEADIDVPSAEDLAEEADGADASADDAPADDAVGIGTADDATTGEAATGAAVETFDDPAADGADGTEADADADAGATSASESAVDAAPDTGGDATADRGAGESDDGDVDAADVDLESAAVDLMSDLDDGDGAAREAVVEALASRYGADADAAEAAIQDALMSGQCYEPDDGVLKAI